jgi:hypothetical protein
MTKLLEQAFTKVSSLPDELQDTIAQNLIQEVEWESQWDNTFSTNQESMDNMALKALQEFKDGKTDMLGFDEL